MKMNCRITKLRFKETLETPFVMKELMHIHEPEKEQLHELMVNIKFLSLLSMKLILMTT